MAIPVFPMAPSAALVDAKDGSCGALGLLHFSFQGQERMLVLRRRVGSIRDVERVKDHGSYLGERGKPTSNLEDDDGIPEIELEEEDEVRVAGIECMLSTDLWRPRCIQSRLERPHP